MLDKKGFDVWADEYDEAVGLSDEENTYPFAGYKTILARIFQTVTEKKNATVLDIGFGTGTLTKKLYDWGCSVYGRDFSPGMIKLASEKMPGAHLFQADFTEGLADPLPRQRYDFILATYSLHHLTDQQKILFLRTLQNYLKDNGKILIGDVAFEAHAQLDNCRQKMGDKWDNDEIYFVVDEMKREFPNLIFQQVSYCSGILALS